jgi:DNA polymerase elongation subunit (family B)
MSNFYTNVQILGDDILYLGYRNGRRVKTKVPYSPSLFIPTNSESKYKTLTGEYLQKIKKGSIRKTKEFIKKHEAIENFKIYGNDRFQYCFISDVFKDPIDWDIRQIKIAIFDIEVNSDPDDGGFSYPENPFQPIISISIKFLGQPNTYVWGYNEFNAPDDVKYFRCKDEYTLCKTFLEFWESESIDAMTGWNIDGYDIPYVVNRFRKILGEKETKRLSPWGIIRDKTNKIVVGGKFMREEISYNIIGISTLDYVTLYKKYQPGGTSQENHKLNTIVNVEIGESKVDYEGSLHNLYINDFQKFIEYNIQDVKLIESLDNKCKLLSLALILAYDSKTNYEDIFTQTRMWDSIIYDFLKKKNIQVPMIKIGEDVGYEGAFVKEPIAGLHKWVVTLDATSLYPSIIMGKNISPETIVNPENYTEEMRNIISSGINVNSLLSKKVNLDKLKEMNVTITPNGQFFRTDIKGFLTEIVEDVFAVRQTYKSQKIKAEKEYELICSELKENSNPDLLKKQKDLEYEISKYDTLQQAKKLSLNSLYGCMGTKFFRFFDVRLAEAITLEGQLSIRVVQDNVNKYLNTTLGTKDKDFVLGIDTDSILLTLEELVNKTVKKEITDPRKITEFLNKVAVEKIQPYVYSITDDLSTYVNSYSNKIFFKLEKICSSGIWTGAKKRYALLVYSNEGVIYSEPKLKVTGLEVVKSTTPKEIKKSLKNCLQIFLSGDEDQLIDYVENFKKEYRNLTIDQISFPQGVNGINKYKNSSTIYSKGTPIYVRASLIYNKILMDMNLDKKLTSIKDGDKIKYVYLKLPNPTHENVIAYPDKFPKEFDLEQYIDYNLMYEKGFLKPMMPLVEAAKWKMERSNSIDDFF